MYRTPEETACLLAVLLKRSGQTRARISSTTVRNISGRTNLRSSFIVYLQDALSQNYDWIFFELKIGGFGAVQSAALEAAKAVTGKKHFSPDERKAITRNRVDMAQMRAEVTPDLDEEVEEDD